MKKGVRLNVFRKKGVRPNVFIKKGVRPNVFTTNVLGQMFLGQTFLGQMFFGQKSKNRILSALRIRSKLLLRDGHGGIGDQHQPGQFHKTFYGRNLLIYVLS
jgi:hypothetical protein